MEEYTCESKESLPWVITSAIDYSNKEAVHQSSFVHSHVLSDFLTQILPFISSEKHMSSR